MSKFTPNMLHAMQFKSEYDMCALFWKNVEHLKSLGKIKPYTIWCNNNGEHLSIPGWLYSVLSQSFRGNKQQLNAKIKQIRMYSGSKAKAIGQMPGLFDYGALGNNGLYFMEAKLYKLNNGKLVKTYMTKEQREFKEVCECYGIQVFEFRTPDEGIEILQQQQTIN